MRPPSRLTANGPAKSTHGSARLLQFSEIFRRAVFAPDITTMHLLRFHAGQLPSRSFNCIRLSPSGRRLSRRPAVSLIRRVVLVVTVCRHTESSDGQRRPRLSRPRESWQNGGCVFRGCDFWLLKARGMRSPVCSVVEKDDSVGRPCAGSAPSVEFNPLPLFPALCNVRPCVV